MTDQRKTTDLVASLRSTAGVRSDGDALLLALAAAEIEAARREGAEAMRESAIYAARLYGQGRQGVAASAAIQAAISALPLPGDDT